MENEEDAFLISGERSDLDSVLSDETSTSDPSDEFMMSDLSDPERDMFEFGVSDDNGHIWERLALRSHVSMWCETCRRRIIESGEASIVKCKNCGWISHHNCVSAIAKPCSKAGGSFCTEVPVVDEEGKEFPPGQDWRHDWATISKSMSTVVCTICKEKAKASGSAAKKLSQCQICGAVTHSKCISALESGKVDSILSIDLCKRGHVPIDYSAQYPNGSISHHWMRNLGIVDGEFECVVCGGVIEDDSQSADSQSLCGYRCSWCQRIVHAACRNEFAKICDYGRLKNIIIPPTSVSLTSVQEAGYSALRIVKGKEKQPSALFVICKDTHIDFARQLFLLLNPLQVISETVFKNNASDILTFMKRCHDPVLVCTAFSTLRMVIDTVRDGEEVIPVAVPSPTPMSRSSTISSGFSYASSTTSLRSSVSMDSSGKPKRRSSISGKKRGKSSKRKPRLKYPIMVLPLEGDESNTSKHFGWGTKFDVMKDSITQCLLSFQSAAREAMDVWMITVYEHSIGTGKLEKLKEFRMYSFMSLGRLTSGLTTVVLDDNSKKKKKKATRLKNDQERLESSIVVEFDESSDSWNEVKEKNSNVRAVSFRNWTEADEGSTHEEEMSTQTDGIIDAFMRKTNSKEFVQFGEGKFVRMEVYPSENEVLMTVDGEIELHSRSRSSYFTIEREMHVTVLRNMYVREIREEFPFRINSELKDFSRTKMREQMSLKTALTNEKFNDYMKRLAGVKHSERNRAEFVNAVDKFHRDGETKPDALKIWEKYLKGKDEIVKGKARDAISDDLFAPMKEHSQTVFDSAVEVAMEDLKDFWIKFTESNVGAEFYLREISGGKLDSVARRRAPEFLASLHDQRVGHQGKHRMRKVKAKSMVCNVCGKLHHSMRPQTWLVCSHCGTVVNEKCGPVPDTCKESYLSQFSASNLMHLPVYGNFKGKFCKTCHKPIVGAKLFLSTGCRCAYCNDYYHVKCFKDISQECKLGKYSNFIIHPLDITQEEGNFLIHKCPATMPLLVIVNGFAGLEEDSKEIEVFAAASMKYLNFSQVLLLDKSIKEVSDAVESGIERLVKEALRKQVDRFLNSWLELNPSIAFHVVAVGGNGTFTMVADALNAANASEFCCIVPCSFGKSNDFATSFGWKSEGITASELLKSLINNRTEKKELDRLSLTSTSKKGADPDLSKNIYGYFSIGLDADLLAANYELYRRDLTGFKAIGKSLHVFVKKKKFLRLEKKITASIGSKEVSRSQLNISSLIVSNIWTYIGGVNIWGGESAKKDENWMDKRYDDGFFEICAIVNPTEADFIFLHNTQSADRIAQSNLLEIKIAENIDIMDIQIDGEVFSVSKGSRLKVTTEGKITVLENQDGMEELMERVKGSSEQKSLEEEVKDVSSNDVEVAVTMDTIKNDPLAHDLFIRFLAEQVKSALSPTRSGSALAAGRSMKKTRSIMTTTLTVRLATAAAYIKVTSISKSSNYGTAYTFLQRAASSNQLLRPVIASELESVDSGHTTIDEATLKIKANLQTSVVKEWLIDFKKDINSKIYCSLKKSSKVREKVTQRSLMEQQDPKYVLLGAGSLHYFVERESLSEAVKCHMCGMSDFGIANRIFSCRLCGYTVHQGCAPAKVACKKGYIEKSLVESKKFQEHILVTHSPSNDAICRVGKACVVCAKRLRKSTKVCHGCLWCGNSYHDGCHETIGENEECRPQSAVLLPTDITLDEATGTFDACSDFPGRPTFFLVNLYCRNAISVYMDLKRLFNPLQVIPLLFKFENERMLDFEALIGEIELVKPNEKEGGKLLKGVELSSAIIAQNLLPFVEKYAELRIVVLGGSGTPPLAVELLVKLGVPLSKQFIVPIPLGVSNSIQRSLGWGTMYERSVLSSFVGSTSLETIRFDIWQVDFGEEDEKSSNRFFSYLAIGAQPIIFSETLEEIQQPPRSSTAGKARLTPTYQIRTATKNRNLKPQIKALIVDGKEIELPKSIISLAFSNVPCFHAFSMWGRSFDPAFLPSAMDDGIIEVTAIKGLLHGDAVFYSKTQSPLRLAQGKRILLKFDSAAVNQMNQLPILVDDDLWMNDSDTLEIKCVDSVNMVARTEEMLKVRSKFVGERAPYDESLLQVIDKIAVEEVFSEVKFDVLMKTGRSFFRRFLEKTFNTENIDFLNDIDDYKNNFGDSDLNNFANLQENSKRIYQMYIVDGSELEVNVSSELKRNCKDMLECVGPGLVNAFDECVEEIEKLLLHDQFPKFLNDRLAKEFLYSTRSNRLSLFATSFSEFKI